MKFKQAKNETFDDYQKRALTWGFKHKQVFPYPKELFDALRPFCVGGFPASIMLFCNELCNGKCYDRAQIMQLAFENCQVVHADINSLRCKANGRSPQHAFVETTEFGGNRTWVVDTSIGLIFDKRFYYKFEQPKVNKVLSKQECMQNPEVKSIIASNFDNDKYLLPTTLPLIEQAIKSSRHIGTLLYKDHILSEIEAFKTAIRYDDIQAEIDADIQLLQQGRADDLDKKFGIVRDAHGREMSRNGVPNPYYKSFEQMQEEHAYYESIKDNPEKLAEYFAEIDKKISEDMAREEALQSAVVNQRLEEIKQNPTANFYDSYINQQGINASFASQASAEQQ